MVFVNLSEAQYQIGAGEADHSSPFNILRGICVSEARTSLFQLHSFG